MTLVVSRGCRELSAIEFQTSEAHENIVLEQVIAGILTLPGAPAV